MDRVSLVRIMPLAVIAVLVLALVVVSAREAGTVEAAGEPQGGPILTKGDNDCDGDSDAVDALVALQYIAGLFYEQEPFCMTLGFPINPLAESEPSGIIPWVFGDIDCDFDVDAVDALLILRQIAGFSLNLPPPELCPPFGAPY